MRWNVAWYVGTAMGSLVVFNYLSPEYEGLAWFAPVPFLVVWYETGRWLDRRKFKKSVVVTEDAFDKELQELLKRESGR